MQVRYQTFQHVGIFPHVSMHQREYVRAGRKFVESPNLPVDQFFSQPHNLKNGSIDTSCEHYDDAAFASHLNPTEAESPLSSDYSDADIHNMTVDKHCQSLAETSLLVGLRPAETEEVEDKKVDEPGPAPQPSE